MFPPRGHANRRIYSTLKQEFEKIGWQVDFNKLKSDDTLELARVLMGFIAVKFKILLHLTESVAHEVVEKILEA